MSENKQKRSLFKREHLMRYISLASIVILATAFNAIQPNFFGRMNISSMLRDNAALLVMAVGMTLVLIICQIDLSVGFAAGFLGACAARLMAVGVPLLLVILIVLAMGVLIGLLQGTIIGKLGVPAFVTTLTGFNKLIFVI